MNILSEYTAGNLMVHITRHNVFKSIIVNSYQQPYYASRREQLVMKLRTKD